MQQQLAQEAAQRRLASDFTAAGGARAETTFHTPRTDSVYDELRSISERADERAVVPATAGPIASTAYLRSPGTSRYERFQLLFSAVTTGLVGLSAALAIFDPLRLRIQPLSIILNLLLACGSLMLTQLLVDTTPQAKNFVGSYMQLLDSQAGRGLVELCMGLTASCESLPTMALTYSGYLACLAGLLGLVTSVNHVVVVKDGTEMLKRTGAGASQIFRTAKNDLGRLANHLTSFEARALANGGEVREDQERAAELAAEVGDDLEGQYLSQRDLVGPLTTLTSLHTPGSRNLERRIADDLTPIATEGSSELEGIPVVPAYPV